MKNKNCAKVEGINYKEYSKKVLFGPIFWSHLVLEFISWSSPFWLDWKIVIVGFTLLEIQFFLLGGCIINKIHFKNNPKSVFLYPYLKMLGCSLSYKTIKVIMWYIIPIVVVLVAIIWQVILKHQVWLNF